MERSPTEYYHGQARFDMGKLLEFTTNKKWEQDNEI